MGSTKQNVAIGMALTIRVGGTHWVQIGRRDVLELELESVERRGECGIDIFPHASYPWSTLWRVLHLVLSRIGISGNPVCVKVNNMT